MNNVAGELYVISEKDVTSGEHTNYYKCGIVREGSERGTRDRLLEHQTGNPRRLFVVETFNTPSVEFVETSIHHRWASKRVSGEWFKLDKPELQALLVSINNFVSEVSGHVSAFAEAEALKRSESNGVLLEPNEVARQWFNHYHKYKAVIDKCEETVTSYQNLLYEAVETGVDVSAVAKTQKRAAPKKFDEDLFASRFPEIYRTYTTRHVDIQGSFRITPSKEKTSYLDVLPSEQANLIHALDELLATGDTSLDIAFSIHDKHLALLEIRNYASWQCEIARAGLQILTGQHDGIESIASWKRRPKEKINFDRAGAQKEFPTEYESCIVEGNASEAMIIKPMQPER